MLLCETLVPVDIGMPRRGTTLRGDWHYRQLAESHMIGHVTTLDSPLPEGGPAAFSLQPLFYN